MKRLAGLAALALVVATTAGCSAAPAPAPAPAPPASAPAGGSSGTSTYPTPTGHGSARTLVLPPLVREQIIRVWVAAVGLERSDVAGTTPGLAYYGYLPSTHTYWAIADFEPTDSWRRRVKASPDSRAAVQFQGSPYVFSHKQGQGWRFLGDTGGLVCPSQVPAPMIAAWGLPTESC